MSGRPARVRAPELRGTGWLPGGPPLTLRGLRGRFVLLDFWTAGCVNCRHVLDELRPLERDRADVLVVLGVHSPKFPHERGPAALASAVERLGVRHPVLDDADRETWSQYAVRAWPTLVLVDPEGYVVHTATGEGHVAELAAVLDELVDEHERRGTLRRGGPTTRRQVPTPVTALRFPGGVAALPDGALLVADGGHHQLVLLEADLRTERLRVGVGRAGLVDGPLPAFSSPQGVCLLPDGSVLVADTGNHALRAVDLVTGDVTTVAGTGRPRRPGDPRSGPAREVPLSSPWDACWYGGRVVVAMAGTHQLWSYDPAAATVEVLAGTGAEQLRDGPAAGAYLAQPSGLAPGADRLWFVDAESSALRWYRDEDHDEDGGGTVGTAVGGGLSVSGHVDGPAEQALLQHPLGVCALPDGSVAVLDTYDGAVRRYDPVTDLVSTTASGLAEPVAAVLVGDGLVVVEQAAHRLVRLPAPPPAAPLRHLSADVVLRVAFDPADGRRLDDRDGPATRLSVEASPAALLRAGGGSGTALHRGLGLLAGRGLLRVTATAASCDTAGDHPACHLAQRTWELPVRVGPGGADVLELRLPS